MREEHMIERQGKRFVLYAGLLEEAHARGLKSIETELIQVPSPENGEVAIARAVVRTEDGKFTGIGDASPSNVGRAIAPHAIRMAETRAKARALRDAINIGATALEELGGEAGGEDEGYADAPRSGSGQGTSRSPVGVSGGGDGLPATRKQLNYLETLAKESDEGIEGLEEAVGKPISEFTKSEASDWIGRLSGKAA